MGNITSYKKGHKHSPEVLEKIAQANRGRTFSPETIAKRVKSRAGYRHSAETIEKIRKANTGKKQSPEQIEKHRQKMLGRTPWNKGLKYSTQTRNEISKKWVENNRDRRLEQARKSHLMKKFGLTLEQYQFLVEQQGGKCAICRLSNKEIVDKRGRSRSNLYVDHCHATGKVRGLLCMSCNTALGHFKDSMQLLISAQNYLSAET